MRPPCHTDAKKKVGMLKLCAEFCGPHESMSSPGGGHQTAVLLCAVAAITRDALWVSLGFSSDASRIRAEELLQLFPTLQATAAVEGWVRQWLRDVRDNPCLRGLGGRCGWGPRRDRRLSRPGYKGPAMHAEWGTT